MLPVIVMPMNDPKGNLFPQLQAITPQLQELFAAAFVSIKPAERNSLPHYCNWLDAEPFFYVYEHATNVKRVGDDFLPLYAYAAASCPPTQIVHLCFVDRVAYALQSEYRSQFCMDMESLQAKQTPVIFQRSHTAWQTHPQNYRALEQMVTQVGEMLLGRNLDFAWCHLAIQAGQLRELLPLLYARDFSFEAEIVLHLHKCIQTREVDWLAWEDPFIEGCEAHQLRAQREASTLEVHKRLGYVVPMLELLRQSIRV